MPWIGAYPSWNQRIASQFASLQALYCPLLSVPDQMNSILKLLNGGSEKLLAFDDRDLDWNVGSLLTNSIAKTVM